MGEGEQARGCGLSVLRSLGSGARIAALLQDPLYRGLECVGWVENRKLGFVLAVAEEVVPFEGGNCRVSVGRSGIVVAHGLAGRGTGGPFLGRRVEERVDTAR